MKYPQTIAHGLWTRVAQYPLYMVYQDSGDDQIMWTDSDKNLILPRLDKGHWSVESYHFEGWAPEHELC